MPSSILILKVIKSSNRDHLEYRALVADRQRRAYELVREKRSFSFSRTERRNFALSDTLHKLPTCTIGSWVRNTLPTLSFVKVFGQILTTSFSKRSGPFRSKFWLVPWSKGPYGSPVVAKLQLYLKSAVASAGQRLETSCFGFAMQAMRQPTSRRGLAKVPTGRAQAVS